MARKPDPFTPVVATANELRSGAVVFRTPAGTWTGEIAAAEIADDPTAAERLLAAAQRDHVACRVVEPVMIEVLREGAFVRPAALRELIRATGPTIVPPFSPAIARS